MNRPEMAVAFGAGVASPQGGCWGQFLLVLGAHEAHPKTTLHGVVFQKLNGPLLTSAPQSPPGSNDVRREWACSQPAVDKFEAGK
jgi:hypothetical protein